MRIVIESTIKVVMLDGVPSRVWEGKTDTGIPCHVFVTGISVDREADSADFDAELIEHRAPSPEVDALPERLARPDIHGIGPVLKTVMRGKA